MTSELWLFIITHIYNVTRKAIILQVVLLVLKSLILREVSACPRSPIAVLFHLAQFLLEALVSFTSRANGRIKFVPHSFLMFLSHKVSVFQEEAICYFIYAKILYITLLCCTCVLNGFRQ